MSDDQIQKLLQGAIKAAKSGDKALAKRAFLQVIKLQPRHEAAWLGLITVSEPRDEQLKVLQQALKLFPDSEKVAEAARRLGYTPSAPPTPAPTPTQAAKPAPQPEPEADEWDDPFSTPQKPKAKSAAEAFAADWDDEEEEIPDPPLFGQTTPEPTIATVPDDEDEEEIPEPPLPMGFASDEAPEPSAPTSVTPEPVVLAPVDFNALFEAIPTNLAGNQGIPQPDANRLLTAARQADAISQDILDLEQSKGEPVRWSRKKRNRAGEWEIAQLRLERLGIGLVIFAIVGGIAGAVLLNRPEFRQVVFAPTWTISPTPTATATSTPGVTPTSSVTPAVSHTPSPTVQVSVTPGVGQSGRTPTPTRIYFAVGIGRDAQIEQALVLIEQGRLDEAEPLLEEARTGTSTSGNFLPYYYLSLIELERGNLTRAQAWVQQGDDVRQTTDRDSLYLPLVNVAYARLDLYRATQLKAQAQRTNAENRELTQALTTAETRLEEAIAIDENIIEAHILLAQRHVLGDNFNEAYGVLDNALFVVNEGRFYTNTRLRFAKAQLYYQQGRYSESLQELYVLRYIDPYNLNAMTLQISAAFGKGDVGLAAIYSEQLLFYYPDNLLGRKRLGDARLGEGKTDAALQNYTQVLDEGEPTDSAFVDALIARANVYVQQRRYDLAQADLDRALALRDDVAVRNTRMTVAYFNQDYDTAREDADRLRQVTDSAISRGEVTLLLARILVDQADTQTNSRNYPQALELLNQAINTFGLSAELRPTASEYLARTQLALGDGEAALEAINSALAGGETLTRRYLRGQIHELLQDNLAAVQDYEFVLSWASVFPYANQAELERRYRRLLR